MSDTTPRLFCFSCGYAHFSLHHQPGEPARPARLFGLIRARAAVLVHLKAICIKCNRPHLVGIGEYRIVTPMEAPMHEYGASPVYR